MPRIETAPGIFCDGNVLAFASKERIDLAWHDYCELALKLSANPRLMIDRPHQEAMAKAHDRWRRLFLAAEGAE